MHQQTMSLKIAEAVAAEHDRHLVPSLSVWHLQSGLILEINTYRGFSDNLGERS